MNCLTRSDLRLYRGLVGLQLDYAEKGDSHKVAEMLRRMEDLIEKICNRVLFEKTGQSWNAKFSEDARSQWRVMVAESFDSAREGYAAFVKKQAEIERWIDGYIQSGVVQATIKVDLPGKN